MKTNIQWRGGVAFSAETGSGNRLMMDGPSAHGGENKGARPMEVFLSGAAGCSAFDVVHILKKARQPLADLRVEVEGTRADSEPAVYTDIHLNFIVAGAGISENAVARAVQLSVEKYCSALRMLAASCNITHSYRIEAA